MKKYSTPKFAGRTSATNRVSPRRPIDSRSPFQSSAFRVDDLWDFTLLDRLRMPLTRHHE